MRALSVIVALSVAVFGCRHIPTDKELQGAQIHYDLGIQAQQSGELQAAFKEFEAALALDSKMPEAHNAIALLYHLAFKRPEPAIEHFKEALDIRPAFSEAKTNLANVYLDQARYDEAIVLYEQVLNDMLYPTPYIAQGNMGWAYFKKGNTPKAIENIKASLTTNPKFCLGYRNLGSIYESQGKADDACGQYLRYQENCAESADAQFRAGVCQAKKGDNEGAQKSFAACVANSSGSMKEDCQRLSDQLKSR